MANTVSAGPGKVNTISASATLSLGNAGDLGYAVSRWIVDVGWNSVGSFTIKPQKAGTISDPSPGLTNTQNAFQDTWYTVATTNTEVAAGTTQAVSCILDVDAAGCDCQLVITIAAGAVLTVVANPMMG